MLHRFFARSTLWPCMVHRPPYDGRPGESYVLGTDVDRPTFSHSHRGLHLDEAPRRPEPQVCDVAAALLRLAPDDRRVFIPSLIAMLERVVADEERTGPTGT